jgi:hypothetical protein
VTHFKTLISTHVHSRTDLREYRCEQGTICSNNFGSKFVGISRYPADPLRSMLTHMIRFFSIALAVFFCLNTAFAQGKDQSAISEKWQTIWNQDQRIGYAHSTTQRKTIDGQKVVLTDTLVSMTLSRFGQTLTIRQKLHQEELADGTLLKMSSILENPPNSRTSLSGIVEGDEIRLRSQVAGNEIVKELTGMQGVRSSAYPERFVEDGNLKLGKPVQIEVFEPQMGMKTTIRIEYMRDIESGPDSGLREVKFEQSLPGAANIETIVYCRKDWSTQKVVSPLMKMEMREATAKEALEPIGEQKIDFALDTMLKVKGLKNTDASKSITYRIAVEGASPAEIFTESNYQTIRKLSESEIELTVTSVELPSLTTDKHEQATVGEEYLQSSQFLETDAAIIKQLAEQGSETSHPVEVAVGLKKFVQGYVSDKNFSTAMATAVEVAKSKAGDCTEHAVLLAALLRAKKIPSRVAIGFVYSPQHQAFVGHMWTEAWIAGNWFPLDAALGNVGKNCGYLTISTSALSDQGNAPTVEFLPMLHLLGRTKIDVVEIIR